MFLLVTVPPTSGNPSHQHRAYYICTYSSTGTTRGDENDIHKTKLLWVINCAAPLSPVFVYKLLQQPPQQTTLVRFVFPLSISFSHPFPSFRNPWIAETRTFVNQSINQSPTNPTSYYYLRSTIFAWGTQFLISPQQIYYPTLVTVVSCRVVGLSQVKGQGYPGTVGIYPLERRR